MSDSDQNGNHAEPGGGLVGRNQGGQSPNTSRRGLGQRLGLRGRKQLASDVAAAQADVAVASIQDNNEAKTDGAVAAVAAAAPPRPPPNGVGGAPQGKGTRRTVAAMPGAVSVSNIQETNGIPLQRTSEPVANSSPNVAGIGGAPQGKIRRTTASPVPSLPGAVSLVEPTASLSSSGQQPRESGRGDGGASQGKMARSSMAPASRPGAVSVVEPTSTTEPGAATGVGGAPQGKMRRTTATMSVPAPADLEEVAATGSSTRSLQPPAASHLPIRRSLSSDGSGGRPPAAPKPAADGGDGDAQALRRKQIQEIMRDTSLPQRERQMKIQELMASGMPNVPAAEADEPEHVASTAQATEEDGDGDAQVLRRKQIQEIMKDQTLSNREKQIRTQQLMAGGMPLPAAKQPMSDPVRSPSIRRTRTSPSPPRTRPQTKEPSRAAGRSQSPTAAPGLRRTATDRLTQGSDLGTSLLQEPGPVSAVGGAPTVKMRRTPASSVPGALSVVEPAASSTEPASSQANDSRLSSASVGGASQGKTRRTTAAMRPGAVSVANEDAVEPGAAARVRDADAAAAVSSVESDLQAKARASARGRALLPGATSVTEPSSAPCEPTVRSSTVGGASQGKTRRTTAAMRPGAVSVANEDAVEPGAAARVSDADAAAAVSSVESDLQAKARASTRGRALLPGATSVTEPSSAPCEPTVRSSTVGGAPQGKARRTTAAMRPGAVSVANEDAVEPGAAARISDADTAAAVSSEESDLQAKARASARGRALLPGATSVTEPSSAPCEPTVRSSTVGGAPQGKARRTTAAMRPGAVSVAKEDAVEPGAADAIAAVSSVESDLAAKARARRPQSVTVASTSFPEPHTDLRRVATVGGAPIGKARRTTAAMKPGAVFVVSPEDDEAAEPGVAAKASDKDALAAASTVDRDLAAKARASRRGRGAPAGPGVQSVAHAEAPANQDQDAAAAASAVERDLQVKARLSASRRGRECLAAPGVESVPSLDASADGQGVPPAANAVESDMQVKMRASLRNRSSRVMPGAEPMAASPAMDDASAAAAAVESDLQAKARARRSGGNLRSSQRPSASSVSNDDAQTAAQTVEEDLLAKRQSRGLRRSAVPGATTELPRASSGSAYNSDDPAQDDYSLAASTVERDLQAKNCLRTSGNTGPGFQSVDDSNSESNRVNRMEAKIRQMEMEQENRDAKLHEIETLDARNAQVQAQDQHQPLLPKLVTTPPLVHELPPEDEPDELDRAALFNPDPEAIRRAEEEGLAIAMAVDEEEEPDIYEVDLKVYDPNSKPPFYQNRRFRCYAILICIITLAVIIATVAIAAAGGSGETIYVTEPPSAAPSMPPTTTRETAVRSELARVLGDAVNEPDTPYEDAMRWILYDDALELDEFADNLVQRYVLALFYFKTTDQGNLWISCNPPADGENATCPFYEFTREADNSINYYEQEEKKIRWLSDRFECEWAQIICYQNKVAAIDMGGQNMTGTIPDELAELSLLIWLTLSFNFFEGTIPAKFAELEHLQYFEVTENLLTGQIPPAFFRIPKLLQLNPAYNELTGSLPTEIGSMTSIQHMFMQNINLEGSIPSEIGLLTDARNLWLFENRLTGTLPSEIGNLQMLSKLTIGGNQIMGPLPTTLGRMKNLEECLIPANSFTGSTIPEEFWDMTGLLWLDISDNNFVGTLSSGIGKLTDLLGVKMRNNMLTGTIPSEIANLDHLLLLWVHNNELVGELPTSVCFFQNISFINADCAGSPPQIQCICCTGCCDEYGTCQRQQ